jgi:hypothetical protein
MKVLFHIAFALFQETRFFYNQMNVLFLKRTLSSESKNQVSGCIIYSCMDRVLQNDTTIPACFPPLVFLIQESSSSGNLSGTSAWIKLAASSSNVAAWSNQACTPGYKRDA